MAEFEIIPLSDDLTLHGEWLARSETLHRMLRPALPANYADYMRLMFAEGAEMAILQQDGAARSLAVYRCLHTTYAGYRFYIYDLVTDETRRSAGHGGALLSWCEARAKERGCDNFALDSGVQRTGAHKFYFRHGLVITAFNFVKKLT